MNSKSESPSYLPRCSVETLSQRAEIKNQIRNFFNARNFIEVETPVLSRDIVVDRYLEPIEIKGRQLGVGKANESFWLQTSPEFCMKRLVSAGANAIYQFAHAFRAAEFGQIHNPEFLMLEWYRVGDDQEAGIKLLSELVSEILGVEPAEQVSYTKCFQRWAGFNGLSDDISQFEECARLHDIDVSTLDFGGDIDGWRNYILTEVIEPQLGQTRPTIVFDWPASQSALAKIREEEFRVAERFELYFRGVELANGYHELTDADELRRRNEMTNLQRLDDGKQTLPVESQLLNAMEIGLPGCSGVALGFDRLVMLACGKTSVEEVMPFPVTNA